MKKVFPVSLDENLIEWVKNQVQKGNFRNRSHVVEFILESYRRELFRKYDQGNLNQVKKKLKQVKDEEGPSG